jgi:glycosyl transferase family 87
VLVVPLSVGSLNNGQSNPLLLGLLLIGGAAAAAERWNLVAGCLAFASLLKLYPVAVGLLLAAGYPRRLGGRFAGALALGLGLPFLLGPPGYVTAQYADWFHRLLTEDRQTWPVTGGYRDLRMLFRLWGTPLGPRTFLAIQFFAAVGIAGLCLARRRGERPHRQFLIAVLGLGCCWMTVLGPATESCTYMLLAPALAWAVIETCAWDNRPTCPWTSGPLVPRGARGVVLASYGLFLVSQVMLWFPWGSRFNNLGSQPVAGLLLFGYLLAAAWWSTAQGGGDGWFPRQGRLEPAGLPPYDRAA